MYISHLMRSNLNFSNGIVVQLPPRNWRHICRLLHLVWASSPFSWFIVKRLTVGQWQLTEDSCREHATALIYSLLIAWTLLFEALYCTGYLGLRFMAFEDTRTGDIGLFIPHLVVCDRAFAKSVHVSNVLLPGHSECVRHSTGFGIFRNCSRTHLFDLSTRSFCT